MFIRTTPTRNSATGETYITHRLVESRRAGDKVRQVTLLNLGRHFPLAKEQSSGNPSITGFLGQSRTLMD